MVNVESSQDCWMVPQARRVKEREWRAGEGLIAVDDGVVVVADGAKCPQVR
jgi:hypothetical protein